MEPRDSLMREQAGPNQAIKPGILPGSVQVVVIDECTFNGPDHMTLGPLHLGDFVYTHESYVAHLLQEGLVCMPEDFDNLDIEAEEQSLQNLDAELDRAIQAQRDLDATNTDDSDDSDDEDVDDRGIPAGGDSVSALNPIPIGAAKPTVKAGRKARGV